MLTVRGTVNCVNPETARRLAEADRLSPSLQRRLWKIPNRWVRRTLAGRSDLVIDLQKLAVVDDDLIGAWAARERGDELLLGAAIINARSEASMMSLIAQPALTESQVAALAQKATTMVGWSLIDHHRVSSDLAVPLVQAYIATTDQADTPGRNVAERLRRDPALLAAAAEAITWKQAGFLRTVASEVTRHPELIDPLVAALVRLDRDGNLSSREPHAVRSAVRSAEEMLRSSAVTVAQLTTLSAVTVLSELHPQISARIRVDLAGAVESLTCTPDSQCSPLTAKRHARILARLSRHCTGQLPTGVAVEAALHHAHLTDTEFADIVQPLGGAVARAVAVELAAAGRIQELTAVVRALSTSVLADVPDATEVFSRLAREGDPVITDRSVPAEFRAVVIDTYQPLYRLLGHPHLLSEILSRIEALPPAAADTALGLLDGWEGDLGSLLSAADTLAR